MLILNLYIRLIVVVVTASKSTRQANRDQASSVAGTASVNVSAKPRKAKKPSGKRFFSHMMIQQLERRHSLFRCSIQFLKRQLVKAGISP